MRRYTRVRRRKSEESGDGFPVWRMVINLILLALPPAVGFWGLFGLWGGFIAVLYLSGVLLYILIVAPWITCTHCSYFERACPLGLGLLSAATYSYGTGNFEAGERARKFFWLFWYTFLPTVSYLYYLTTGLTPTKLIYFFIFVVVLTLFWINGFAYYITAREKGICLLLSRGNINPNA
jgi:hypothetical protein